MTARFLSPLCVKEVDGEPGQWVVLSELVFDSEVLARRITVPAGFKSDFASVPRIPFAYMLFGGIGQRAAVAHDYAYSTGIIPREQADGMFREALRACGVSAWKAALMYAGVRLMGGSHYTKEPVAA